MTKTPDDWARTQPLDPLATPTPPLGQARKRRTGLIVTLATIAALLAGGGTVLYLTTRTPAPDPMAQVTAACEEAVKQRLKAPATAKFSHVTTSPVGYAYQVKGDVDAENGFSALVRSKFTCAVHHDADGWQVGTVEVGD